MNLLNIMKDSLMEGFFRRMGPWQDGSMLCLSARKYHTATGFLASRFLTHPREALSDFNTYMGHEIALEIRK
jgi:hypothetical protein